MKDTIYTQIQENKNIGFDTLFQNNSSAFATKAELGTVLRELESDKKIFQFANAYYDLAAFADIEGYVQWNMNGFCWLSDTDNSNQWAVSFNPDENLLSVYNKREAFPGSLIKGKKIVLEEDKEFVFITETTPSKDFQMIASYNAKLNHWISLNSSTIFTFSADNVTAVHDDIAIFDFKADSKAYHYQKTLGNRQENGIESQIIALLADLQYAPQDTLASDTSLDNVIATLPVLNKPFYTIDSKYTNDIDDAIYIEKNNEQYTLWVAIADVSSYVKPGDELDIHAQKNCTSFYLPHQTIHMLARQLAENWCSLNVGQARSAMICKMDFDATGEMLTHEFFQSNITSHARLTYEDVDKMVEGRHPDESYIFKHGHVEKMTDLLAYPQITQSLHVLEEFSVLKNRHQDKNYFVVEQPEYHLGENGKIDYLYEKEESTISRKMVESAMLSANIAAARFIYEKYPSFGMFRNQYEPPAEERPKPAFYHFNNEGHWGLQTEFYTHFTSPIRRECDLIVHRLIKGIIYNQEKTYSNDELQAIADNINLQQYKAKQCAIKAKNLLVPQYVETLNATGNFNDTLEIIDFSENGIACRNKQLVEIFIPAFKLEKDITRALQKVLPADGSELDVNGKKEAINQLNQNWELYMKLNEFSWTDDRKNAYYQITRKKNQHSFKKSM
jgi:exoribonuclease R